MSEPSLIPWIKFIIFGEPLACLRCPPRSLEMIFLKMEVDGIRWQEMGRQGGLALYPYRVNRDLDALLSHLEQFRDTTVVDPPSFQSGTVHRFFDNLSAILARSVPVEPAVLPDADDHQILDALMQDRPAGSGYQSAYFWGELARHMIQQRRPFRKELTPLPPTLSVFQRRAVRLYDLTCDIRGRLYDPLSMYLVPHHEYVDAVHWQTEEALEAFIRKKPHHPLSQSIQRLLTQSIDAILRGTRPKALVDPHPELDQFLANVHVVHDEVQQVQDDEKPPKTVDVFQRLLALCDRDHLWDSIVYAPPVPSESTVWNLTERLLLAERRNAILLQRIPDESYC